MCKVIICANQKGGVAKTTTVVNVGIGLVKLGKKVLVIDNDPQGSLTEALGHPEPNKIEVTLASIMEWVLNEEEFDLTAGILHHKEGVDLMPGNKELAGVAGVIIFTALAWAPADMIGNNVIRIIVKIVILVFFIVLEFCVWINATLPWLERKFPNGPNVRKVE